MVFVEDIYKLVKKEPGSKIKETTQVEGKGFALAEQIAGNSK